MASNSSSAASARVAIAVAIALQPVKTSEASRSLNEVLYDTSISPDRVFVFEFVKCLCIGAPSKDPAQKIWDFRETRETTEFPSQTTTPADPQFSGGRTRTGGSCIFGRANAHLRILHFWVGEGAPADPPFSDGRTRTCVSSIFGRANAHLGILYFRAGERETCRNFIFERANAHLQILHFRADERAPANPPFSGRRTRTCGSSIFGRANAHLQIFHFWAGERAPTDAPFSGG